MSEDRHVRTASLHDELIHETPAIVSRQSPSALAYAPASHVQVTR